MDYENIEDMFDGFVEFIYKLTLFGIVAFTFPLWIGFYLLYKLFKNENN